MIFIELEIENLVKCKNSSNSMKELVATYDYFNAVDLKTDEITSNYYNQFVCINNILTNEMAKVENELFKKWDLNGGLYVNDEDSYLMEVINNNLGKKYYEADTMSEVNSFNVLENCKDKLIEYFETELENYSKKHNLSEKKLEDIKSDVSSLVEKHFYNVTDSLLNDKEKEKLEKWCNKLEEAYELADFGMMNHIANKIKKEHLKSTTLYRDSNLYRRLEKNMLKNKIVQNKLTTGKEGKLNDIEEKLLDRFSEN